MHCIHVGPGQLGLGLVAAHLIDSGFEVCLVGKPAAPGMPKERKTFGHASTEAGSRLRYLTAAEAANAVRLAELPESVRGWISSPEPLLITFAVGEKAAASCMPLIDEIVRARPRGRETVFIACENKFLTSFQELHARHPDTLVVCRAVVDRVCFFPRDPNNPDERLKFDEHGRRVVNAHPVWEWVVEVPEGRRLETVEALKKTGVAAHTDIEPWRMRKLWIVNGIHQVLALYARAAGLDVLSQAARDARFESAALPLTEAIRDAHHAKFPGFEWSDSYVTARMLVFREAPDETVRLLEDHLRRRDFSSLIERLDERLFSAAQEASSAGCDVEPFMAVVAVLLDVISEPARFYDHGKGINPDPELDRAMLDKFERSLAGWMPEEDLSHSVGFMEAQLAATRVV